MCNPQSGIRDPSGPPLNHRDFPLRRGIGLLLALLLSLSPAAPAWAQKKSTTDDGLANEPISAKIAAKPNIMMTLDNSGSMNWDFLPDQVVGNLGSIASGVNYCRNAAGAMTQACGGNASVTNYKMFTQGGYPVPDALTPPRSAYWPPATRVPDFNGMAYNPAVEYKPPLKATFDPTVDNPEVPGAKSYPEMNFANTSNWTNVPLDGFGTLWPLTTKVSMNNAYAAGQVTVGRWCNSDWPLDVTSGDHCRSNGLAYGAGANGAPQVTAAQTDWLYPVQPTGFNATNSNPVATQFHYIEYALWCKKSNDGWDAGNVADADGTGKDCRHNNKAYALSPAVSAALNNYPDATYKYRVVDTTQLICKSEEPTGAWWTDWLDDASGSKLQCRIGTSTSGAYKFKINPAVYGTIPPKTDAPWHYWRGEVEWCKTAVPAAASGATTKWQGYGAWSAGNCQGFANATYKYPRFFKYMQASGYDNVANQALEYVPLDFGNPVASDASYVTTIVDSSGATVTQTVAVSRDFSTDTYNANGELTKRSQMTNFANWFAYYRSRILAAKTVSTRAFANLDNNYRVGFGVFTDSRGNPIGTNTLPVTDFTIGSTARADWYQSLIDVDPANGTPTFAAMARVGEYFSGTSTPIQYSCQKNWHVLFTDGYANNTSGISGPTAGKSFDTGSMPAAWPAPSSGLNGDKANVRDPSLTPGAAWPYKYREGSSTDSQKPTLADIALYYWMADLKTSGATATNDVPISTVPPIANLDEYAISVADPASWQHVNFAAISFGARGTLDVSDQKATLMKLSTTPPATPNLRWPAWVNNGPAAVDDLWHAAVNGRGRFVNAANPDQLGSGLARILNDVAKAQGARVGVGFVSATLGPDTYVYKASFEQGWVGVVKKVAIDPTTGDESGFVAWSAADLLGSLLTPSVADPTPWLSDKPATARKVVTINSATGLAVPFRLANLSGPQQLTLGGDATRQQLVVEYLRGSNVNESDDILGRFRVRGSRLGDVVNSQAIYVGKSPSKPYLDATDPGYSSSRRPPAPRAFISVPTTAWCMRWTMPRARRCGLSCRRRCTAQAAPVSPD